MPRFPLLPALAALICLLPSPGLAAPDQTCARGSYYDPGVTYGAGGYAIETAIADLDADGKLDLAVANYGDNNLKFLKGNSDGTFSSGLVLPLASSPRAIAAADLDHDGRMDLVVTLLGTSSVVILRNVGPFTFNVSSPISVGTPARGVGIADLNGDGILDIATATENGLTTLRGQGTGGVWDGTFAPMEHIFSPWLWHLTIGDVDADGLLDVVGSSTATSVQIFWNPATSFVAPQAVNVGGATGDVALADFNNDGKIDIVASNATLPCLLNQGSRTFTVVHSVAAGVFNGIAAADIDFDGKVDVLGVNADNYRLEVSPGRGDGSFEAVDSYATGNGPVGIRLADLNGDASSDVVVANTGTNNVSVFLSRCSGPSAPAIVAVVPNIGAVGDTVSINGSSLGGATQVRFNGIPATFEIVDNSELRAVVPVGATTGPISVTNPIGTGTSPSAFVVGPRPEIDAAIPNHAKRGVTVQLKGLYFTGTTRVRFASNGSAAFHVTSDSEMTAVVDTAAVTGPILVTNGVSTGASSFAFTVDPADTIPHIVAVKDVPNDQGGKVFVTWTASDLDAKGLRIVTGYRIWRRAPSLAALSARPESERLVRPGRAALTTEFWEAIATLPATALPAYAYTAATTQDSLPTGNPRTAFFVQVVTTDAFTWYNSAPDSGYSVDNLSPPQPQPFVASFGPSSVALHWGPSSAADFAEFRLYRGASTVFVPGPANLVTATPDTGFVDPGSHSGNVYKLAAVDIHGNPSHYAVVSVDGPTSTLVSLVSADGSGGSARLRWYAAGNAGLSARLERAITNGGWESLRTLTADPSGYFSYEDRAVTAGERYGYRLIVLDGDREAPFGEVWLQIGPAGLQLRVANPIRTDALDLDLVLEGSGPARVEVLDVAGRRLADRRLDGLGPGPHHVRLQDVRVPPGIVLVRLTEGGRALVARTARLR